MYKYIEDKLRENIDEKRIEHSFRVLEIAEKLGNIYNEDIEKLSLAALLHDCAKFRDNRQLLKKLDEFGIILDNIMSNNHALIHGPLGAKIAEKEYNIKDKEILNAIKYHTTGRENMTMVEKIIFIADYIEPGRSFPGVEEVRKLAYIDIDKSIILAMDQNINFLIVKGKLISLDTVKARNYLKIKVRSDN